MLSGVEHENNFIDSRPQDPKALISLSRRLFENINFVIVAYYRVIWKEQSDQVS